MSSDIAINLAHKANAGILAYLKKLQPKAPTSTSPQDADLWGLDTHPEVIEAFWNTITTQLPAKCGWIVYNAPVLIHPQNGIIFGFARGTKTVMLCLPETEREQAFQVEKYGRTLEYPNTIISAADVGSEWALVKIFGEDRIAEWTLCAYEYAEHRSSH